MILLVYHVPIDQLKSSTFCAKLLKYLYRSTWCSEKLSKQLRSCQILPIQRLHVYHITKRPPISSLYRFEIIFEQDVL